MKTYPRVENKRKPEPNPGLRGSPCLVCKEKTTGTIDIQFNIFRGDDERARVCKACQKLPSEQLIAAFIQKQTQKVQA